MTVTSKSSAMLDFLSLGALVHRLDPGIIPFKKANTLEIHVSGGEFNCAANLANCFGLKTGIATAMVNYPIGDMIAERVRAMGVTPYYKHFEHNGVSGPNMATVYSDRGFGVRGPEVFYNRANEAGGLLKAGDFDWDEIFKQGVRWFHSGGIFAALSGTTPGLIIEAMKAAKKAGATVSFDLNYRAKLWNHAGGLEKASKVFDEILANVDVLIGVERPGEKITVDFRKEPEAFAKMVSTLRKDFPNISAVATTLREEKSANRHLWTAIASVDGQLLTAPEIDVDIYDRVGSGDGFAAGFFYGLMESKTAQDALMLGWAHGALLNTTPGDTTMATMNQVLSLANGGSTRIQR